MNKFLILIAASLISFSSYSQDERTVVKINTSYGNMVIELYNETPKHKDNFIKLVKKSFYDGTLFHRVIPGFMIQGGDPTSKNAKPKQRLGNGGPGYTVPSEFNEDLFHKKGALAAAREPDAINPKKASSGSQFYIVEGLVFKSKKLQEIAKMAGKNEMTEETQLAYTSIGGYPYLDGNYTVFGEVTEGMKVITKIANVKRDDKNRPIEDIKMKITIIQ
jgi:cyclophilin family peptidyl-prolyl cis-trans isomerase